VSGTAVERRRAVRFGELSRGRRVGLVAAALVDLAGRAAVLVDLRGRPADGVRGPRWAWATAAALVSSAGLVPAAYFTVGVRRTTS